MISICRRSGTDRCPPCPQALRPKGSCTQIGLYKGPQGLEGVGFKGPCLAPKYQYMVPRRRVAGPPPPWYAPPPPPHPSPKPRLSFQQTVIRHPRNCPPKLGLAPWPTHGTTRQGTTGAGWGRITHNTGNHRAPAPSPSPPLRHTGR